MVEAGGLKFLADENVSPNIVSILRKLNAGFIETVHKKEDARGIGEEAWIPPYTERGYVIISPDRAQLRKQAMVEILVDCGARMIYLPRQYADSTRWDQALWFLKHWWKIVAKATDMSEDGEVVLFAWNGKARVL